jgi:hypothetical protein
VVVTNPFVVLIPLQKVLFYKPPGEIFKRRQGRLTEGEGSIQLTSS